MKLIVKTKCKRRIKINQQKTSMFNSLPTSDGSKIIHYRFQKNTK